MAYGRQRIAGVLSGAIAVAAAATLLATQDVGLRYRWTKGQVDKYQLTQEVQMHMGGIPGLGEMTVTTTIGQAYSMTAMDVAANGNASLNMVIDAIKMSLASPMMNMSYDSAAGTAPTDAMGAAMANVFSAMIGKNIQVVMTPRGSVEQVSGASEMLKGMAEKMGGMSGPGMPSPTDMFSNDSLKAMFSQSFAMMPPAAVGVGGTWSNAFTIPNPLGDIAFSGTSTLSAIEKVNGRDMAKITVAFTTRPAGGPTNAPASPIPMTVTLGLGKGDSEIWFDIAAGRVEKVVGNTAQPMDMSMTLPDGQTMSLQADTRTKQTLERVQK